MLRLAKMMRYVVVDGLKALAFWIVASLIMIMLWGYNGRMLSTGLGVILGVAFAAVTFKRIVYYLQGGYGEGAPRPPSPSGGGKGPQPLETPQSRTCPNGDDGYMTCTSCGGNGVRYGVSGQLEPCFVCQGRRRVPCGMCSGTGRIG